MIVQRLMLSLVATVSITLGLAIAGANWESKPAVFFGVFLALFGLMVLALLLSNYVRLMFDDFLRRLKKLAQKLG